MPKIFEGEAMRSADLCCGSLWTIIAVFALIICLIGIWVYAIEPATNFAGNIFGSNKAHTSTPVSQSQDTPVSQSQDTTLSINQRCSITGKWTETEYQGSPVSGVYIQIYPDNRIELYLNGQLHNQGTWEWIAINKFRAYWSGRSGQSASGIDTVTISQDCNTQTYNSQREERSVFVRS